MTLLPFLTTCHCFTLARTRTIDVKVTLAWDPPIIDGGTAIFDYEISYSVHEVVKRDKCNSDVITPAETVSTSRSSFFYKRLVPLKMERFLKSVSRWRVILRGHASEGKYKPMVRHDRVALLLQQ